MALQTGWDETLDAEIVMSLVKTWCAEFGCAVEAISIDTRQVQVVYARSGDAADPQAEMTASVDGRTLYFKSHDAAGRAAVWSVPSSGRAASQGDREARNSAAVTEPRALRGFGGPKLPGGGIT